MDGWDEKFGGFGRKGVVEALGGVEFVAGSRADTRDGPAHTPSLPPQRADGIY